MGEGEGWDGREACRRRWVGRWACRSPSRISSSNSSILLSRCTLLRHRRLSLPTRTARAACRHPWSTPLPLASAAQDHPLHPLVSPQLPPSLLPTHPRLPPLASPPPRPPRLTLRAPGSRTRIRLPRPCTTARRKGATAPIRRVSVDQRAFARLQALAQARWTVEESRRTAIGRRAVGQATVTA